MFQPDLHAAGYELSSVNWNLFPDSGRHKIVPQLQYPRLRGL